MKRLMCLVVAALLALPLLVSSAALPESAAVTKGADFIRTTQVEDGGFGGFGPGQSMDAIFALRAAGVDPATVKRDGKSPADFLAANASGATTAGAAAKAALAAKAMNLDPRNLAGVDLVATIQAAFDGDKYADDDFTHSIAILGLACTGNDIPGGAVMRLRETQLADGGWGFEGASDPDTSAIAAQALIAAGVPNDDPDVLAAIAYFKAKQGNDGGWGFSPDESNTSSTAFVVQALLALGEKPEAAEYTRSGKTAVAYLVSKQLPDGSFEGFDPAYAANQVVPALAGRTFCNAVTTSLAPASPSPATASATASSTATVTPSASATASTTASKTATIARTATPRSPRVGSGQSNDGPGGGTAALLAVAGGVLMLTAAGGIAAATIGRRRR